RRHDEVYLDALGAERIPDPTTAGDFCRRFAEADVLTLMDAINEARLRVWEKQPPEFFAEAILEADGSIVPSDAECKQGMDFADDGQSGYHPLLISLANTAEPLFLFNRSGNRPSQEQADVFLDKAIALCRRAGFRTIRMRGDTKFAQTKHLDRWDEAGDIRFLFGYEASAALEARADDLALTAEEVVFSANDRCDQENLIAQLKSGVRALTTPVDDLVSNWAYMVMGSLAWSLKAWSALLVPVTPRHRAHHEAEKLTLL